MRILLAVVVVDTVEGSLDVPNHFVEDALKLSLE